MADDLRFARPIHILPKPEKLVGLDRPAEVETLDFIAKAFAQEGFLFFVFHAFRHHGQVQRLAHVDDGARDGAVFEIVGRFWMKERSTLSVSMGKFFNCASDE